MRMDLVVVSYQTPPDLSRFLEAYSEVEGEVDARLTVVNVEPWADDHEVLEAWAGKLESLAGGISHRENIGYARACNDAASGGDGDIVGFFNADTELRPGVLRTVLAAFDTNADVGIVGPKQVDEHGRVTHAGIFGTNEQPSLRGWHAADRGAFDDVRTDAVSVSGAAYFVRRSMWEELTACESYQAIAPGADGAFLPTQHYYEETFCSYHARAHGWDVMYLGDVTMIHRWHRASPIGGFADRMMEQSRRYFRAACDVHGITRD